MASIQTTLLARLYILLFIFLNLFVLSVEAAKKGGGKKGGSKGNSGGNSTEEEEDDDNAGTTTTPGVLLYTLPFAASMLVGMFRFA